MDVLLQTSMSWMVYLYPVSVINSHKIPESTQEVMLYFKNEQQCFSTIVTIPSQSRETTFGYFLAVFQDMKTENTF